MKKPWVFLSIPLLAFIGRMSGASWGPRQVGEILVSLSVGVASWYLGYFQGAIGIIVSLLVAGFTYASVQTGHGNVYHMGFLEKEYENSPRGLDRLFGWFGRFFGEPRSAGYCWALMGVKGLCIGLGLFPYGLPLVILWPLSYYISFRFSRDSEIGEWLSHGALGICLVGVYLYGA